MRKTVLLSAPYMIPERERFQSVFDDFGLDVIVAEVEERLEEDQVIQYAGKFDGVVCGDDHFTAHAIEACLPRLKVISKWGTGIDSIDREAAARLDVMVGNTPDAFTIPVSDNVLAYMLTFARKIPWMDMAMKSGKWDKMPGRALSECVLGVIGVGRIGKAVTRRARAFGMQVFGNDIVEISPNFIIESGIQMIPLADLLGKSDFVSLNCDLNPTSEGLINGDKLALMKPDAVLINTSRGSVVVEQDLIEALQSGTIAGAALDVFEREPLPLDSPFLRMDNVLLAPHNANSSPAAWERVHWNTIRNLLKGLGLPYERLDPHKYG
jgi:D-3-phosphoglycerate dehydrogenase